MREKSRVLFPAYEADSERTLHERVYSTFTYEQLLSMANAIKLLTKIRNKWMFRRFFAEITDYQDDVLQQVHNSCVNCCISLDVKVLQEDKEHGK